MRKNPSSILSFLPYFPNRRPKVNLPAGITTLTPLNNYKPIQPSHLVLPRLLNYQNVS